MHRPVAFQTRNEMRDFLFRKAPLHAYYSTAYYSNPEVPMKEKKWMGADLVFDLDADHLPGAEDLSYPEQMELVKNRTKVLLEEFIFGDFGFSEEDTQIVFSGHRGYHIHVRDKKVLDLSSNARREIVDHITGTGLHPDAILPHEIYEESEFMDRVKRRKSYRLPPPNRYGWRKRYREMVIELLERWSEMSQKEVMDEISEIEGIGEKIAKALYDELYKEEKWKLVLKNERLDVLKEEKRVNQKHFMKIFHGIILEKKLPHFGAERVGETDEPVTGDIKRLIRLPTSLHGGSFLVVKPLSLEEFYSFFPLEHAVPEGTDNGSYTIFFEQLPEEDSIMISREEFIFEDKMEVPTYAVPFLCSKYKAKLL